MDKKTQRKYYLHKILKKKLHQIVIKSYRKQVFVKYDITDEKVIKILKELVNNYNYSIQFTF